MIVKLLSVFLVSTAITNVNSWNSCDQTFCKELRYGSETIVQKYYINGEISIQDNNTVVAELKTDAPSAAPMLQLNLKIFDDGIVHLFIDVAGNDANKRFRPTDALASDAFNTSELSINNDNAAVSVVTGNVIKLEITKNPFGIKTYHNDRLLSEINPNNNFVFETIQGKYVAMGINLRDVERAYGIPEHADHLALKSTKRMGDPYRHFNLDYGHYQLESREALYGTIGVLYGHGTNYSSGVFWLNAAQTWIDLENAPNNIDAYFMSESGVVDMFILPGPTLPDAVKQYAKLTGTAPLPQYFTLGYHQSRYSYMTQNDVLDVVKQFDESVMPVDVMWLDIDYTDNKKYFTWDPTRFATPAALLDDLDKTHRQLVAIIDPHIKVETGYMVHDNATANKYYVTKSDGLAAFEGNCWPGLSSYLDFLNPAARNYYSSLYSSYNFEKPNINLWNDMNEPAVFDAPQDENSMPLTAKHYGGWEHRDVHNIYGFYQTMGTKKGLLDAKPNLRPFILTRSHFAGIQRYAAIWTGDNAATWGYLQMSFPMCLTEALAGVSFCGADVGGFAEIPEDELYQRWYQAGAWLPFYRGHSATDVPRREPYLFNENIQHRVRTALFQRYAHMPVWYTLFYEHEKTGEPVIRPTTYNYPREGDALSIENQIFVGENILAAPVLEKGVLESKVYLPGGEGQHWFNIDENYKAYSGIGNQLIDVSLDSVPVFYRAGSIIPRKDVKRQTSEETHQDPFTLYICLNEDQRAEGRLYVDDYKSFEYQNDKFLYVNFNYANNTLSIENLTDTKYDEAAPISEIIFINSNMFLASALFINENGTESINAVFSEENNLQIMKNFNFPLDTRNRIEFTFGMSSSAMIQLNVLSTILLVISIIYNY